MTTTPILPSDILKFILDIVAKQESKSEFLRFFRVSRLVQACAEYNVYSSIVLKTKEQVTQFAEALDGKYIFSKPNHYIRHLYILYSDDEIASNNSLQTLTEKCPNLVRLAFDGIHFPDLEHPGQLSMLSLCLPSRITLPQSIYPNLTHLHILGPGDVKDTNFYSSFFSPHINDLTSLQELCIELTQPSPDQHILNHQMYSESALFYVYLEEDLLRNMFQHIPSLRRIIIKSDFQFQRFRFLWDEFGGKLKDESRVVFSLDKGEPCPRDCYISDLSDSHLAWVHLRCHSLEAVDRLWSNESSITSL